MPTPIPTQHMNRNIEIEVVLRPDQGEEDGIGIAADLMTRLGIDESSLVDRAYIDLLLDGKGL